MSPFPFSPGQRLRKVRAAVSANFRARAPTRSRCHRTSLFARAHGPGIPWWEVSGTMPFQDDGRRGWPRVPRHTRACRHRNSERLRALVPPWVVAVPTKLPETLVSAVKSWLVSNCLPPNAKVHPPGPLQRRGVARNKNAAPVGVQRLVRPRRPQAHCVKDSSLPL